LYFLIFIVYARCKDTHYFANHNWLRFFILCNVYMTNLISTIVDWKTSFSWVYKIPWGNQGITLFVMLPLVVAAAMVVYARCKDTNFLANQYLVGGLTLVLGGCGLNPQEKDGTTSGLFARKKDGTIREKMDGNLIIICFLAMVCIIMIIFAD